MEDKKTHSGAFIRNVLLKTAAILLVLNVVFVFIPVEDWLGKVTLYNRVYPGRWRLSWSENPTEAYSVSTNNLDALFGSHEVADRPIQKDEFRIFFFGDSSVWGFLLPKEDTLTALINEKNLETAEGENVRAYNLGYPTISLTKDLLLIQESLAYEPDMIVWFVTLEAFPDEKQVFTPLVQENRPDVNSLIENYRLEVVLKESSSGMESYFEQSIFGRRREIADLLRLQLYGVLWSGTGKDQEIPESYTSLQVDYEDDDSYYDFTAPALNQDMLALDVLAAGVELSGAVPLLIVNEPIYISAGENSDIRYNFFYPRWAYDDYRMMMSGLSEKENWEYLDLWDKIPPENFTNTAIHIDAQGSHQLADLLTEKLIELIRNAD